MTFINTITNAPSQTMTLKLDNGNLVIFSLWYSESQRGWYYSIEYGNINIYNRRLIASPNMLRTFRYILPFGLACTTSDEYEPVFIEDFSNGRAQFFLLNSADVVNIERSLSLEGVLNE